MSQTVITQAFVEWKAQQATDNQPVTLDEFIFAYVPGLDVSKPISNTEGVPAADNIVYRQAVSKTGVVNANAVVYSVTMGADVGDFDFNWIGIINKASGTLAMIIHAPTQRKVQNADGQQGNVLVRSMLMEYSGAQAATNITTPAETWQIDFTARLAGMDEAVRLAALDIYGAGAFFDDGFLVAKTGTQYFVTKGLGYVGGLRAALAANQNITVPGKPAKVWADVCYQGTLTSAYKTAIAFTVADTLKNYTTDGVAHYVFALANIDAAGVITDLRPKGSIGDQTGNENFLRKDKNLTDIANAETALNTLGGVPKTRMVNQKKLSEDIELSPDDVGALPSGGTAVAATKLATPRKIAGVAFDGTADISLSSSNVGAYPATGGVVNGWLTAKYLRAHTYTNARDGQGTYIGWDDTVGGGESDFVNNPGTGTTGGFLFRTVNKDTLVEVGRVFMGRNGSIAAGGAITEAGQRVYSPNFAPPYPVTSVNGAGGAVRTATASLAILGWHRDEATGMISQWGVWTRSGTDNTVVFFPFSFPTAALNIQLTLNSDNSGGSGSNIGVVNGSVNNNGFVIFARSGENSGYWRATGV